MVGMDPSVCICGVEKRALRGPAPAESRGDLPAAGPESLVSTGMADSRTNGPSANHRTVKPLIKGSIIGHSAHRQGSVRELRRPVSRPASGSSSARVRWRGTEGRGYGCGCRAGRRSCSGSLRRLCRRGSRRSPNRDVGSCPKGRCCGTDWRDHGRDHTRGRNIRAVPLRSVGRRTCSLGRNVRSVNGIPYIGKTLFYRKILWHS